MGVDGQGALASTGDAAGTRGARSAPGTWGGDRARTAQRPRLVRSHRPALLVESATREPPTRAFATATPLVAPPAHAAPHLRCRHAVGAGRVYLSGGG